jgi:hypothetical protein
MNFEEAKNLRRGEIIHHASLKNRRDGTPQRFKVNGKVKLWKRTPGRIRVPLKRGLHEHGYLTETNLGDFVLTGMMKKGIPFRPLHPMRSQMTVI